MPGAGKRRSADVSLKAKLERALSARGLTVLTWTGELVEKAGAKAYLVGGIVRDAILGCPNTDLDVMVEGEAEVVARALARRVGGRFKKPTEFGTCKVEAPGLGTIDFATSRRETYSHPGALPKVVPSGIEEDLWRRDFTINAMAVCLNPGQFGKLFDPCGGHKDLLRGYLRVMHAASFTDDPTRILRGIRFAARSGYRFDAGTLKLLRASVRAGSLKTVSGRRIYRELNLICAERQAAKAMKTLEMYQVLESLCMGRAGAATRHKIWLGLDEAAECAEGMTSDFRSDLGVAWFASLFAGLGARTARQLAVHLNLPREVREASLWTALHLSQTMKRLAAWDETDAYKIRLMLDQVPPPCLMEMYALSAGRTVVLMEAYLGQWRHVKSALTGGEIAALGLGQGPRVGKMLKRLLKLRLEGKIRTRDDEVAVVKREIARASKAPRTPGKTC